MEIKGCQLVNSHNIIDVEEPLMVTSTKKCVQLLLHRYCLLSHGHIRRQRCWLSGALCRAELALNMWDTHILNPGSNVLEPRHPGIPFSLSLIS